MPAYKAFLGEREKREAKMGASLPAYSSSPSKISFPLIPKVGAGVGLPYAYRDTSKTWLRTVVYTCVKQGVFVTSYHDIHSINFFGYFLVDVDARVTDGNNLVDVLLLEFFHSFPH